MKNEEPENIMLPPKDKGHLHLTSISLTLLLPCLFEVRLSSETRKSNSDYGKEKFTSYENGEISTSINSNQCYIKLRHL